MISESVVCWIKNEHKHWLKWVKPSRVAVSPRQPKGTRLLAMPRMYLKPPKYVDGRSRRRFIQVKVTIDSVGG